MPVFPTPRNQQLQEDTFQGDVKENRTPRAPPGDPVKRVPLGRRNSGYEETPRKPLEDLHDGCTTSLWKLAGLDPESHAIDYDLVVEYEKDQDQDELPRRHEAIYDLDFKEIWTINDVRNPWFAILSKWVKLNPVDEAAVYWLNGDLSPDRVLTWTNLRLSCVRLASYMMEDCGLKKGDRVILCFPPGVDFILAFFACLMTGVIAVPVYPPTPANQTRDGDRFLDIRKNAGVTVVLTNHMYKQLARLMFRLWRGGDMSDQLSKQLGPPKWITIGDAEHKYVDIENFSPVTVMPWNEAFLQFTSGSTSQPKGVVVTHGNLVHNIHLCGRSFGLSSKKDDPYMPELSLDDKELKEIVPVMRLRHNISRRINGHPIRVFSWLPVYHDMGLIGGLLSPLYGGCQLYQVSPIDFIKRPELWMEGMSRFRCSCCAAPNFAFELAVKRTTKELLSTMDLRHVAGIICGAEPIRTQAMSNFFNHFAAAGLTDKVIIPAYGLAENTLITSSRRRSHERLKVLCLDSSAYRKESRVIPCGFSEQGLVELSNETSDMIAKAMDSQGDNMVLVGCGPPAKGVTVKIVNANTFKESGPGFCGEVWVSSPSTARGYYRMKDKTEEDFGARYKDDPTNRTYLRTGDTGFLYKNELFISGRMKDMLVVRGRNYYPQDVEVVVDTIPETRAGCSVVFSNDHDVDELCVAAELRDHHFRGGWGSGSWIRDIFVGQRHRVTNAQDFDTDGDFYEDVSKRIIANVEAQVGLKVCCVFLLRGRTLTKTTSGKVRRHAAKTTLLSNNRSNLPGLLYTYQIADGSNAKKEIDLDTIELRTEWGTDVERQVCVEAIEIVLDCLSSSMIPKLPHGMDVESAVGNANLRNEMRELVKKAVFELGMDSPSIVMLDERIRRRILPSFNVFHHDYLFKCPTLSHIVESLVNSITLQDQSHEYTQVSAEFLERLLDVSIEVLWERYEELSTSEVDPKADYSILSDRVQVSASACRAPKPSSEWTDVLLTGATGYIGAMQLKEILLKFPNVTVHCVVRADSREHALTRLMCTSAKDLVIANLQRVVAIVGDVTEPNFGMEMKTYRKLCTIVDAAFHTAADINLARSYDRLRSTNVLSTGRVIEFCSDEVLKPLSFASTLGIFPQYFCSFKKEFADQFVHESMVPDMETMSRIFPPSGNGYPWTKLVSEKMVKRAASQGLPCTIFRFPLTCMSYETGNAQHDNVMIPLMLAAVQEGIIPKNFLMTANTPADVAAKHSVMVGMAGHGLESQAARSSNWLSWLSPLPSKESTTSNEGECRIVHLVDTTVINGGTLANWIGELGVPLDIVNDPWTLVEAARLRGAESAMAPVLHMTRAPISKHWFDPCDKVPERLPVSVNASEQLIRDAYRVLEEPISAIWPLSRDVFKRTFLNLANRNQLSINTVGASQVIEDGQDMVLMNNHESNDTLSPKGSYNSAFALSQSLLGGLCQRLDEGKLNSRGQLMFCMWAKYSALLAKELIPSGATQGGPDAPPVLVFIGPDRIASSVLQTLLSSAGAFRAPSLSACLPEAAPASLASDMFEVYDALGVLGSANTRAIRLLPPSSVNKESLFESLAGMAAEDTLLLEMMPGSAPTESLNAMYGTDWEDNHNASWAERYAYHRQFLSRRDFYGEGYVAMLGSPLHTLHLDELQAVYPNAYFVVIESHDAREAWAEDSRRLNNALMAKPDGYEERWMKLHDSIANTMSTANLPGGRFLKVTSDQVFNSSFEVVNSILKLIRNDEVTIKQPELSFKPVLDTYWALYQKQSWICYVLNKSLLDRIASWIFLQKDESGDVWFRSVNVAWALKMFHSNAMRVHRMAEALTRRVFGEEHNSEVVDITT